MSTKKTAKSAERGRPLAKLSLPQNSTFTVPFLFNREQRNGNKITKVTVFNHVKRALANKQIKVVGKKVAGQGRPVIVYQNAKAKAAKKAVA